jgi:uncharacterized protein (DUF1499 family)
MMACVCSLILEECHEVEPVNLHVEPNSTKEKYGQFFSLCITQTVDPSSIYLFTPVKCENGTFRDEVRDNDLKMLKSSLMVAETNVSN